MATPGKPKNFGQQWLSEVQQAAEQNYQARPIGMPSLQMIKTEALRLGLTESDAEVIYDHWLTNGFRTKLGRIRDWRAAMRTWMHRGSFPSQRTTAPAGFTPPSEEEFLGYC